MNEEYKILEYSLPNMPWEDCPANCDEPMWRFSKNPVITRRFTKAADRIYNSALVPFDGKFHGIFRIDGRYAKSYRLYHGVSDNALDWQIEDKPIVIEDENGNEVKMRSQYDPRIIKIGDEYFINWCNANQHGPTIGIAKTKDFKTYNWVSDAFLPFNRNGVMMSEKFGDDYLMLNRPSDNLHTAFGDIWLSRSKDLIDWGRHEFVMGSQGHSIWEQTKIGAGPTPIKTNKGWLLFYHGVCAPCNGYVYSMGAALLDIDNPAKVLKRSAGYLICPEESYETTGHVPNVVFPVCSLVDSPTGRIAIYYGAADTHTAIAFTTIDKVMTWLDEHNTIK